jgi:predicted Zn-dependent protease
MLQLVPPDTHHLSSAIGWLELGNPAEAKLEFNKISESVRQHPDVLELEWMIVAQQKDWVAALEVAQAIIHADPDRATGWLHQAYALRRTPNGGLLAAWNALSSVMEKFPSEPTVFYNLSCYACQMDQLEQARRLLEQAMTIGHRKRLLEMALADDDLKPLWEELRAR